MQGILHGRIRIQEPSQHHTDPQNRRQWIRPPPVSSHRIHRRNPRLQTPHGITRSISSRNFSWPASLFPDAGNHPLPQNFSAASHPPLFKENYAANGNSGDLFRGSRDDPRAADQGLWVGFDLRLLDQVPGRPVHCEHPAAGETVAQHDIVHGADGRARTRERN